MNTLNLRESSMIKFARHNCQTNMLYVWFRNTGKCYWYKDVPLSVVHAWEHAESTGKFFNENIKWNYEYGKSIALDLERGE